MRAVRNEKDRLANRKKTNIHRVSEEKETPEIVVIRKHQRQTAPTLRGKRLLKAAEVSNRMVQDNSSNSVVLGAGNINIEVLVTRRISPTPALNMK